jgi:hypothetical protein
VARRADGSAVAPEYHSLRPARPLEFLARIFWPLSGQGSYFSVFSHPSGGRGYLVCRPSTA